MANTEIPWGVFQKSDWVRIPGRKFKNPETGIEISRRQYDKHYGALVPYGSYEKKAAVKKSEPGSILRPARGRKNATKLTGAARENELSLRKLRATEAAASKRIAKERGRAFVRPKKITVANFKAGKISRTIELPVEYEPIEETRAAANASRVVFGYVVGANLINENTGEDRTYTQFALRHISMRYSKADFAELLDELEEIEYATVVSLFIKLSLKMEVAKAKKAKAIASGKPLAHNKRRRK